MGCIWLIAERSELLKQYLCKLLVRKFIPDESFGDLARQDLSGRSMLSCCAGGDD
jgi:hypothetical protein